MKKTITIDRRTSRQNIKSLTIMGSLATLAASPIAGADPALIGDSYVISGSAKNFGKKNTILVATGKAPKSGYLKFDLDKSSPNPGAVAKATLKVYVSGIKKNTGGVLKVHEISDTSWKEAEIAGISPPAIGLEIPQVPPVAPLLANQWLEFDVTDYVSAHAADPSIGFALTGTDTLNIRVDSKETKTTGHEAELNIVWATAGVAGATGPQGPQGDQGLVGPQGIQGLAGPQGVQGLVGPQGVQGLVGPQGVQGLVGPQGVDGLIGPQGAAGAVGTVANAVISTATDTASTLLGGAGLNPGETLTAVCDAGQMAIGGGIVGSSNLLTGLLGGTVVPVINAPVLDGVLPVAGQVANGWQGSWGLINGLVGAVLPTGTYTVYAICAPDPNAVI